LERFPRREDPLFSPPFFFFFVFFPSKELQSRWHRPPLLSFSLRVRIPRVKTVPPSSRHQTCFPFFFGSTFFWPEFLHHCRFGFPFFSPGASFVPPPKIEGRPFFPLTRVFGRRSGPVLFSRLSDLTLFLSSPPTAFFVQPKPVFPPLARVPATGLQDPLFFFLFYLGRAELKRLPRPAFFFSGDIEGSQATPPPPAAGTMALFSCGFFFPTHHTLKVSSFFPPEPPILQGKGKVLLGQWTGRFFPLSWPPSGASRFPFFGFSTPLFFRVKEAPVLSRKMVRLSPPLSGFFW